MPVEGNPARGDIVEEGPLRKLGHIPASALLSPSERPPTRSPWRKVGIRRVVLAGLPILMVDTPPAGSPPSRSLNGYGKGAPTGWWARPRALFGWPSDEASEHDVAAEDP